MHLRLDNLNRDWKLFRSESERLCNRILSLIELVRLKSDSPKFKTWMFEKVAAQFGVSSRTLYRWAEVYDRSGINALKPKLAPGRKRKHITGWIAKYIKTMRDDYNWGAEVICAHLREDYGIELSQYKIHRFLKDRKYIEVRKRKIKPEKFFKKVQVFEPGIHTQLDVKHLPKLLRNGKKCYVYNFVDHASRWQFKMAFEGYGAWETSRFMQALLDTCPFTIKRLQTDHGVEFTYKFMQHLSETTEHPLEHICKLHGIRKALIPVGEKEQNGLVERSHRQDDNELYETIRPMNILHFNTILQKHVKWLNAHRRRKPIHWRTANEYLKIIKESKQYVDKMDEANNKSTAKAA